jgi:hypothetical protein
VQEREETQRRFMEIDAIEGLKELGEGIVYSQGTPNSKWSINV